MNHPLVKKLLPHIIALVVFIAVSMAFCWPVMEGNVMNQHDTVGWKGMAQNSFEYHEKNGKFPLWNPNLFGGMPNYQVAMQGKTILPDMVKILSFGLPKPVNFFFLACAFFYVLCLVLRVRPIIGILSAIAYSFSTYNPVLIAAGHDTQMLATAFMPLVMAGLISIYEKKYWLGFALTTFGAYQQIAVNHLQVTYYFFLIAALVTIFYVVKWIKEKDWKHVGIAGALSIISAIIALAGNALTLKTTSEYSKYTMRGGKDIEIKGDTVTKAATKGLDTAYAFEYSLGKAEALTLLMPNAFGGGSYARFGEGSKVAKKLISADIDESAAEQIAQKIAPKYWGKIFTAGPAYLGVLIFLLGVIGFVVLRTPLRWGLLAATLLGIAMTWGKNFAGFNVFLFENLPFYNKFRAPSFAQVIPQFTLGIMAALTLHKFLFAEKSIEFLQKNYKTILYTLAAVFGILVLLFIGIDYRTSQDAEIGDYVSQILNQNEAAKRAVMSGLKAERQAMFGGQILRAFSIVLIAAGALYLFAKGKINTIMTGMILLIISTLDITVSSYKFFNNNNDQYTRDLQNGQPLPDDQKLFVSPDDFSSSNFSPSAFDNEILKDIDLHYRVFNMIGTKDGGPFSESRTSYYHKSVGGYHPAKLRIYQDIIEKYLSGMPNPQVLNMLNTKYVIVPGQQEGQQPGLVNNPDAYGACWLVSNVKVVEDRVASLKAIGATNLRDTAIIEKSSANGLVQPQRDSASTIKLTKFDNDKMEYEANCNGPQFAVFSEVYYPKGWNAYIDGKKVEYINTNYVLRGLPIPTGKHKVEFVFEPESVKSGMNIMFIASIIILISLLGGLFMAWKTSKKA